MKNTLSELKNTSPFFICYFAFLATAAFFLLSFSKTEIYLYINSYHSPFFDNFFIFATQLGEGVLVASIIIFLLFIKYRHAILLTSSILLSTLIIQVLKHLVFSDALRPMSYFTDKTDIYFVPGVDMNSFNSFPSGHTAAGFCLFLSLTLILNKKFYAFIFFIIAFLIGYSRMYLSQHFLVDVYFGSLISVTATLLCFVSLQKIKAPWLNKSILKR